MCIRDRMLPSYECIARMVVYLEFPEYQPFIYWRFGCPQEPPLSLIHIFLTVAFLSAGRTYIAEAELLTSETV